MSTLSNGSIKYTTTVGSDVTRDGFYAELCRASDAGTVFVAEAFWSDETLSFSVTVSENPVPFSVLEAFLAEARLRVPPSNSPQESNVFTHDVDASGA
ncbi:hypothetical protein [Pseudoxanthomonas sp. LARHCG66]|jgi:hypothetical protein